MEAGAAVSDLRSWHEMLTRIVEVTGVTVIVIGGVIATAHFLTSWRTQSLDPAYRGYRRDLGRSILLGLELLVAADIIGTVAVHPTFQSLGILAGIVLIRTFLSFSLEVEISGRWPWQGVEETTPARDSPRLEN